MVYKYSSSPTVDNNLVNNKITSRLFSLQEEDVGLDMSYQVTGLDACTCYNISVKVNWADGTSGDVQTIKVETEPAGE